MSRILGRKYSFCLWLQALVACVVLLAAPAAAIDLAQGLGVVQGTAYDEVSNRLYLLDAQTGELKSLELTPGCEAATPPFCVSTTVAPGFQQPTDVAVNAAAGLAYVVDSKEPALWRVDLKSKAKFKIASGIGTFSQIALAPEINSAYVTDYVLGKLWRVDLSAGSNPVPLAEGLRFPSGLAVNADRTLAYVADQSGAGGRSVISEIDLGTGARTRTVASSGVGNTLGFLAWTDSSESALYTLENRIGDSRVLRVDLVSSAQTVMARFVTDCSPQCEAGPSGLAVNPSRSSLYVGLRDKVIRLPLQAPPAQRVFLSIGNIPTTSTSIDQDGYANTPPFVDSPFGGTLDIFGNLTLLKATYKADSYRILVSRPPNPFVPIQASWTANQWNPNPNPGHYEPKLIAPDSTGRYSIPQEYGSPLTAPLWSPTYLMMRWPTSDNGKYILRIQIFDKNGTNITHKIPPAQRSLTIRIDNTPPVASLQTIRHGGLNVSPCEIVQTSPNSFDFELEASDATEGHLLGYSLRAVWGRNQSATIHSDSYSAHKDEDGAHLWKGGVVFRPTPGWEAKCNCAHAFTLQVSKRTTNGYSYILSSSSSQSITINNTGNTCP